MSEELWYQEVISFWFEELEKKQWFVSSDALDEKIRSRFASTHGFVSAQTDLSERAESLEALATVIVLDQFSRNMFRGTPDAFSSDALALHVARQALERELHASMTSEQKQFLYMPFMHSENLDDQQTSLTAFEALGLAEHAIEHKDIIERFGRFPYRNAVLGRESTKDELEWLDTGKRFGQ